MSAQALITRVKDSPPAAKAVGFAAVGALVFKIVQAASANFGREKRQIKLQDKKEGTTVFKYFFSPPARLVHTTALLCGLDEGQHTDFVDIDLHNADQFCWWFLRVNPRHQVPALRYQTRCMAGSRELVRFLFNTHMAGNSDQNDHWYPADEAKRKAVDEAMEWSRDLHLCIEHQVRASSLKAAAVSERMCGSGGDGTCSLPARDALARQLRRAPLFSGQDSAS